MNMKIVEKLEQRRRPGQDGEASRLTSQNQFPGPTAFGYIPRRSGRIRGGRWRASPAKAALFGGRINKRGLMDDLFDFLFTVLISFFVLFFINGVLDRGIQTSHSATRTEIAEFREQASAITHLTIQAQQPGEQGEIRASQLDQKLGENSVVGGKRITTCQDYETKVDCENDLLKAGIDGRCKWKKTTCTFQPVRGNRQ